MCSLSMNALRDQLRLNNYSDQLQQVREQLALGEDPNHPDGNGYTPLHRAITSHLADNVEVIEEYMKAGADVNLRTHSDCTPLHFAVIYQKTRVVETLIRCGAAINAKDSDGRSALHFSVSKWELRRFGTYVIHPNTEIVQKLLTHEEIDRNAVDSNGETPLIMAIKHKEYQVMRMLCRHHPNPNICNHELETPLHVAFAMHSMCAETLLVLMGANICCVDKHGKTPFDIFIQNPAYESQPEWTMCVLRIIAFQYNIADILMEKLDCFPDLKQLLHRCSKEVLQMRTDFISPKLTVHDFILTCFNENQFENPLLQIYQPIVERLIRDDYHEYFRDILETIPLERMKAILESTATLRYVEGHLNPLLALFSTRFQDILISEYLDHMDAFCLIVALTNVKDPETMMDLHNRSMSVRLELL